jgi:ABC-type Mn2+/Zn2+ transport system permease subunit
MIQSFFDSWALFHNTYIAGWLSGILLAMVGVLVVAREQVFLSAAVAQASSLGIALGMWVGGLDLLMSVEWLRSDAFLSAMAVAFAVAAALTAGHADGANQFGAEAITGWVFLAAASGSTLILAHSPHGLEEIHRLLSSSLIGANEADVWLFAGLNIVTALGLIRFHRKILITAMDPLLAAAIGLHLRPWSILTASWLGLVVGLAMRSTGMLYTFGCLVLPSLLAKLVCREVRAMFVAAPLAAFLAAVAGFIIANEYDYPPAQTTVALLCAGVVVAWLIRRLLDKR